MLALLLTAQLWNANAPAGATLAQAEPPLETQPSGALARACEHAAENDRLTHRAFEVGAGTSQDLVVSEFQLFQARMGAFLAEAACDW
ncbi:hypothetical protein [Archangium minus]|uniref:hypothetical protein n=1 Tax=Archangium minus TaxID=83450 RepID=UPI0037C18995